MWVAVKQHAAEGLVHTSVSNHCYESRMPWNCDLAQQAEAWKCNHSANTSKLSSDDGTSKREGATVQLAPVNLELQSLPLRLSRSVPEWHAPVLKIILHAI